MQIKSILKILGILLTLFSFTMLTPVFVALYFNDSDLLPYFISFGVTFVAGLLMWGSCFRHEVELKIRDGFIIVTLFWTVLSAFCTLPFMLGLHHHMDFTNAMFESVSGFTTTGASAISNLNRLPPALLYYRQQLQFLGGMGIVVLAMAILPMLRVGGMQLYRAETPGPMKDDKITPRITETAKAMWIIYVGLVAACALAFWASGMPIFDAVEESFATVSTGGFSTHNTSFAFYHSHAIELVAILFMFLGGANFSLHYLAMMKGSVKQYWQDDEFKSYFFIVLAVGVIGAGILYLYHVYSGVGIDFIQSLFAAVSVMTTTGFVSADYAQWPMFIPFLIMMLGLLGSCGGSTSGGLKVIRLVLLKKQFSRELKRLIHPQGVYPLKLNGKVIPTTIMDAVWAFVTAYIGLLVLSMVLLMATGIDLESAFGAAASCLGNVGCGIGQFAYNYAGLDPFAKWVLIFTMIAGRLEVFTVLVLFSRSFWRN